MKLTRSDKILKYIVEFFIKHAEPVGSKTLISEYDLPYSSATVRNEMFALEQEGYIEKTHSSSGRVPSAKGYRYYCENLRDSGIDEKLKYSIQEILNEKTRSVEETIKAACEILSHMTSLVSVFLGPDERIEKLASVQLIKVSERSLTAIFVTDSGYVENKTFLVNDNIQSDEVVSCIKLLNDRLVGTPINELVEKMESLRPLISDYIVNHDVLYQALIQTFLRFANDRLSLYGREELFNQPEFKNDVDKLQKVFQLLSDKSFYKKAEENGDSPTIKVQIGEMDENVSMVSAKIRLDDENVSTIALIGPTRMDYEKALSALEYLAESLSEHFTKDIDEDEDEDEGGKA